MRSALVWGVLSVALTLLFHLGCQRPDSASVPSATPTLHLQATIPAGIVATSAALPTATLPPPTSTPTPTPSPTATLSPTPTPTPDLATRYGLLATTSPGLTLYYAPTITETQVRWVQQTFTATRQLLATHLGVELASATVYLLPPKVHDEIYTAYGASHPEWVQGFARETSAFINEAPRVVWDTSVEQKERLRWLGEHIQEITQATAAHELTHVALHSHALPRWLDEGIAEYIEAIVTPPGSATNHLLQRRYQLREAIDLGLVPTMDQLAASDWATSAGSEEQLRRLYDTSALIVQAVASTGGQEGLRRLLESMEAQSSVDMLIQTTLRPWLATSLPEERAALVLCGVNRFLSLKEAVVEEWNVAVGTGAADYTPFRGRMQELLALLDALASDSPVEEIRQTFRKSITEWAQAVESYIRGDIDAGNSSLIRSNSFGNTARQLLEGAWNTYVVVPCALVELPLPS